ncbi:MAG: hypothetical protein AB1410_01330 [Acidobacteriota bacterium]
MIGNFLILYLNLKYYLNNQYHYPYHSNPVLSNLLPIKAYIEARKIKEERDIGCQKLLSSIILINSLDYTIPLLTHKRSSRGTRHIYHKAILSLLGEDIYFISGESLREKIEDGLVSYTAKELEELIKFPSSQWKKIHLLKKELKWVML